MNSNLVDLFKDIAQAIRSKTGNSDKINAQNFPQKIREIGASPIPELPANLLYWTSFKDDEIVKNTLVTMLPADGSLDIDKIGGLNTSGGIKQVKVELKQQFPNLSVGGWFKWDGSNSNYQRVVQIDVNNQPQWYAPYFRTVYFEHDYFYGSDFTMQIIKNPTFDDNKYHFLAIVIITENNTTTIKEYWDDALCYISTGSAIDFIKNVNFSNSAYYYNGIIQNLWIFDDALNEDELKQVQDQLVRGMINQSIQI